MDTTRTCEHLHKRKKNYEKTYYKYSINDSQWSKKKNKDDNKNDWSNQAAIKNGVHNNVY